MSDRMLKLNNIAVEDSSSMRVITAVTLVYLPSSFVGVSSCPVIASSDADILIYAGYSGVFWNGIFCDKR